MAGQQAHAAGVQRAAAGPVVAERRACANGDAAPLFTLPLIRKPSAALRRRRRYRRETQAAGAAGAVAAGPGGGVCDGAALPEGAEGAALG